MKAYLSASSAELPRARVARDALRELGVTVVGCDWIEAVAAHGGFSLGLPQSEREAIADGWLEHIRVCDVLVALVPYDWDGAWAPAQGRSDGLVAEVTMARCLGKPVVLASRVPRQRLHPCLLREGWDYLSEDDAALRRAYAIARRA